MVLSKQEIESFLPLPGLWSKNFFFKMCLTFIKVFKINFQNRKWNYLTSFITFKASDKKTSITKWVSFISGRSKLIFKTWKRIFKTGNESYKQKMELFNQLPGLWSKHFFGKIFQILTRSSKLIFKTGNGIYQTGNGII